MNKLKELSKHYNTDKGYGYKNGNSHRYVDFYEQYFSKYKKPIILEIGVWYGDSIRLINDYYDGECEIYCVDIQSNAYDYISNMQNVHFFLFDQSSRDSWNDFNEKTKNVTFDIILDDGGHKFNQQLVSLYMLHKRLNENGIYIIEDLHTSLVSDNKQSTLTFLNYFSIGDKDNNGYLFDKEYDELRNSIKDVIISNVRSSGDFNKQFFNRSITSIITF